MSTTLFLPHLTIRDGTRSPTFFIIVVYIENRRRNFDISTRSTDNTRELFCAKNPRNTVSSFNKPAVSESRRPYSAQQLRVSFNLIVNRNALFTFC